MRNHRYNPKVTYDHMTSHYHCPYHVLKLKLPQFTNNNAQQPNNKPTNLRPHRNGDTATPVPPPAVAPQPK